MKHVEYAFAACTPAKLHQSSQLFCLPFLPVCSYSYYNPGDDESSEWATLEFHSWNSEACTMVDASVNHITSLAKCISIDIVSVALSNWANFCVILPIMERAVAASANVGDHHEADGYPCHPHKTSFVYNRGRCQLNVKRPNVEQANVPANGPPKLASLLKIIVPSIILHVFPYAHFNPGISNFLRCKI